MQYLSTGTVNGPGLFGVGGAFGVTPLPRLELHNIYNGVEMILIVLGFWHSSRAHDASTAAGMHDLLWTMGPLQRAPGRLCWPCECV